MRIKVDTLGCKVNTYESEYIKEIFIKHGDIIVSANADVVIINTCSVTNQADSKSRKIIRRERRNNPDAIIVVCGCMAEFHQNDLDNLNIDISLGNRDKSKIPDLIQNFITDKKEYKKFYNLRDIDFEDMIISHYQDKTRAFVKIEDGCNNFCSYCVIPYVRGIERSKDFNKVINEVKKLVLNGHREIVFTGIHTGNYQNKGKRLVDIIREISKIDALERIRISSIEITELDEDFLKELKNNDKICNHLHIPLQSGCNKILKAMNRKYDILYFKNKLAKIRRIRPKINVTTDVIVGFPDETDDNFMETFNNCKDMKFGKIHVFPYSKRDGTKAALMNNQINGIIKKNRVKKLLDLSDELSYDYEKEFIKKESSIIVEESNDISWGYTSNYLKVFIDNKLPYNSNVKIKISQSKNNMLWGEIYDE